MPSKRGLGKNGLDVMFEPVKKVVKERQAGENVGELAVKNLIPNPYQPRHTFDEKALEELTQSVQESGIIQPLIVRKRGEPMKLLPESAVGELPRQRGSSRFLLSSVIMMTPL